MNIMIIIISSSTTTTTSNNDNNNNTMPSSMRGLVLQARKAGLCQKEPEAISKCRECTRAGI